MIFIIIIVSEEIFVLNMKKNIFCNIYNTNKDLLILSGRIIQLVFMLQHNRTIAIIRTRIGTKIIIKVIRAIIHRNENNLLKRMLF
jgi:hypothetical protein